MVGMQGSLARPLDIVLILVGAQIASQIRLEGLAHNATEAVFVAFAEMFALAFFPAFGVYQSWRGRSMPQLVSRVRDEPALPLGGSLK